MKTSKIILLFVLMTVSYYGCFNYESVENNGLDQMSGNFSPVVNLPGGMYYTFSRDYRKCMSPRCGGYWIKAVNDAETVCPDGTIGGENGCYVADFDRNGIELNANDLVIGKFRKQKYGRIVADHLDVSSAFSPLLSGAGAYEQISLIQDSGIRCITTPCNSEQIVTVNTDELLIGGKYEFTPVDKTQKRALKRAFDAAYNNGGALVEGTWISNGKKKLGISNLYTRKDAASQVTPYCAFMKEADNNTFIAWNVDSYEAGKKLLASVDFEPGTEGIAENSCGDYKGNCTRIWAPICGTIFETGETRTYGNLCVFNSAIRQVAGKDAKAKGSWTVGECPAEGGIGDVCGGRGGKTCQNGLFCKYETKDTCGASDIPGTCSEYPTGCPRTYEPVCGCDGRDYSNECGAWRSGVSASYEGKCNN